MKNKLFWIFVIIGLLALIVCLILKNEATNEATWVIAAFTIVLAITTTWNAIITQGLLKQSKTIFLLDTIERTINYLDLAGSSDEEAAAQYLYRKITLIGKIGDNYQEEFLKDLEFWAVGRSKKKGAIPLRILKRVEKLREEGRT